MNTKILKNILKFVCIAIAIVACENEQIEEENNVKEETFSNGLQCLMVPDTTTNTTSISKKAIGKKFSEVYVYNVNLEPIKHKTIKIRNVKGTICQEWFYENLRTNWIEYSHYPNDSSGTIHGYFYQWEDYLNDVPQSDWNDLIVNADDKQETGFHIPNESDISNLIAIVGNTPRIRTILNLEYGNAYYDADLRPNIWSSNTAGFWINPLDYDTWKNFPNYMDPNKIEGCGVAAFWYRNDTIYKDGMWITHTNIKKMQCSVRLMRTINKNQW